ncbi:hypothetical protein [Baekduia alba]|uniref:hypothetical protein n=1 Tax=Baekduia alba TaxID=2997333 RepID=UPI0023402427|nr:hypothetical protein [Baekduia alba]
MTRLRPALHRWAGDPPHAFWSIFAGTLINRVGTFVEPFLALYLTSSRDLSPARAGTSTPRCSRSCRRR